MKLLVALILLVITLIPFLFFAVLLAPLGVSGNFSDGYTDWINSVCECELLRKDIGG